MKKSFKKFFIYLIAVYSAFFTSTMVANAQTGLFKIELNENNGSDNQTLFINYNGNDIQVFDTLEDGAMRFANITSIGTGVPTRNGYAFYGYYLSGEEDSFINTDGTFNDDNIIDYLSSEDSISSPIVLKAKWERLDYQINLVSNKKIFRKIYFSNLKDAIIYSSDSVQIDSIDIPECGNDNYEFAGFYIGNTKVIDKKGNFVIKESDNSPTGEVALIKSAITKGKTATLKAKWKAIPKKIENSDDEDEDSVTISDSEDESESAIESDEEETADTLGTSLEAGDSTEDSDLVDDNAIEANTNYDNNEYEDSVNMTYEDTSGEETSQLSPEDTDVYDNVTETDNTSTTSETAETEEATTSEAESTSETEIETDTVESETTSEIDDTSTDETATEETEDESTEETESADDSEEEVSEDDETEEEADDELDDEESDEEDYEVDDEEEIETSSSSKDYILCYMKDNNMAVKKSKKFTYKKVGYSGYEINVELANKKQKTISFNTNTKKMTGKKTGTVTLNVVGTKSGKKKKLAACKVLVHHTPITSSEQKSIKLDTSKNNMKKSIEKIDTDDLVDTKKTSSNPTKITCGSNSISVGSTTKFKYTVKPANASQSVKITSNKKSIVKVTKASGTAVKIKGVKVGSAKITVKSSKNSKIKKTCTVTVKKASSSKKTSSSKKSTTSTSKKTSSSKTTAKKSTTTKKQSITSISSTSQITVKKGKTKKISYSYSPKTAKQNITWSSSNKSVATVNSSGKVTGKKKGTAKITLTIKDKAGKSHTSKTSVKVTK